MSKKETARELFRMGYNCSQAVFAAFANDLGLDTESALKIASGFGGGIGRMRETCGALSGMLMAEGLRAGNTDCKNADAKNASYVVTEELASRFEEACGSMKCGELLGIARGEKTTPQHMEKCAEFVMRAAEILEAHIGALP